MVMNALIGAAGQMSDEEQEQFQNRVCADGEVILAAFKTKRDSYVFTDRRFMYEDVQGHYRSETQFEERAVFEDQRLRD